VVPDGLYGGGEGKENELESCFESVLQCATDLGVNSLSIPALGCGVQGWRPEVAGRVALETTLKHLCRTAASPHLSVVFVIYSDDVWRAWTAMFQKYHGPTAAGKFEMSVKHHTPVLS
jgi:O-acetyl-ADP-ribose deacetylase (regulator of RNase III)